jgi:hypothetical protein
MTSTSTWFGWERHRLLHASLDGSCHVFWQESQEVV